MLIIDLFPSTVTTCREDPRRVPSATTAWLNLRLKKEGGGGRWEDNGTETYPSFDLDLKNYFWPYLGLIYMVPIRTVVPQQV